MAGSIHLNLGQGPRDQWAFWEIHLAEEPVGRPWQEEPWALHRLTYTELDNPGGTSCQNGIVRGRGRILGSATSLSGVHSHRAGALDPALDFTLFQNLLHGIGQGEVPLTALRQAASPGPSSTALVRSSPQLPQGLRGQV